MSKVDPIVYVLRRFRENQKISQERMAFLTGISISTIQRIESGRTDMKLSQYRQYLVVLELSDMDVSVSLMSHEYPSDRDVSALSRRFPSPMRKVIARFLYELAEAMK